MTFCISYELPLGPPIVRRSWMIAPCAITNSSTKVRPRAGVVGTRDERR